MPHVLQEDEHDMEIDTASSVSQSAAKHPLPELEIFCYLLFLIFLIDEKKYNEVSTILFSTFMKHPSFIHIPDPQGILFCFFQAKACASASINRLRIVNRRTVDVLASRLYFYYSYCYEITDSLAEIRG